MGYLFILLTADIFGNTTFSIVNIINRILNLFPYQWGAVYARIWNTWNTYFDLIFCSRGNSISITEKWPPFQQFVISNSCRCKDIYILRFIFKNWYEKDNRSENWIIQKLVMNKNQFKCFCHVMLNHYCLSYKTFSNGWK